MVTDEEQDRCVRGAGQVVCVVAGGAVIADGQARCWPLKGGCLVGDGNGDVSERFNDGDLFTVRIEGVSGR